MDSGIGNWVRFTEHGRECFLVFIWWKHCIDGCACMHLFDSKHRQHGKGVWGKQCEPRRSYDTDGMRTWMLLKDWLGIHYNEVGMHPCTDKCERADASCIWGNLACGKRKWDMNVSGIYLLRNVLWWVSKISKCTGFVGVYSQVWTSFIVSIVNIGAWISGK